MLNRVIGRGIRSASKSKSPSTWVTGTIRDLDFEAKQTKRAKEHWERQKAYRNKLKGDKTMDVRIKIRVGDEEILREVNISNRQIMCASNFQSRKEFVSNAVIEEVKIMLEDDDLYEELKNFGADK